MTVEEISNWLSKLKVGDQASIVDYLGGSRKDLVVTRVTEKTIFVGDRKFGRNSGAAQGIGNSGWLRPPLTPEEIKALQRAAEVKAMRIKRTQAETLCQAAGWKARDMTAEQCERLIAAVEAILNKIDAESKPSDPGDQNASADQ